MALKKQGQVMRRIKTNATPVPMPTRKPNRAPGQATPVPMPTRVPNLSLPPDQRAKAKPMPRGPKKSRTSGPAKPKQLGPKKPPNKASGGEILGKFAKEVGKAAISPIIAAGRATTLPYRAANKVGKRAKNAAIPKRIVKRAGNGRMSAK